MFVCVEEGEGGNSEPQIMFSKITPNEVTIKGETTKGGTIGYDLRKIGGTGISGQLNYTLAFADGTGSNANDGLQYIQGGLENLRILIPLNFDRRHSISMRIDFLSPNENY